MIKNVISVIDGETGSCGKAKVIGEIATDPRIKLGAAITNCMPNAGHTFVDERGVKMVFRNIPVSSVNRETDLFIGPGSAIDMEVFVDEYERAKKYLGDRKIYVHELVPLIEERHKAHERATIKSGSTFKGGNAASQEKLIREQKLKFFKTFKNAIVCGNEEWLDRVYRHLDNPFEYVLLEGAQGCDLSINHSGNFPYTTCRNVSTAQMLADCGISPERLLQTIMTIRPFPIRINNVTSSGEIIYSGGFGTGTELYWIEIDIAYLYGGYPHKGMLQNFPHHLDTKLIKKYMTHCPIEYLKQLFGEDYKSVNPEFVGLEEAVELERLYHKAKGNREYETKFLDLGMFDSEFPPNTIIDISEQASVTMKERRIADLDIDRLRRNCKINTPSHLYLNFFQHLGYDYDGAKGNFQDYHFDRYIRNYLDWLETETGVEICALGTGPKNGEKILKMEPLRPIQKDLVYTETLKQK